MVSSVYSATPSNVYINTSASAGTAQTASAADFKDTQAYQALVKLASEGYKGADGKNSDKAALQKEAQQLLNQLQAGLGSSDTLTGNMVTVAMPKASSLVALIVAMIESENDAAVASNKMSSELGVLSHNLTSAAADELRKQGEMALFKGITAGTVHAVGAAASFGTSFASPAMTMSTQQAFNGMTETINGVFDMQIKNMEAEQNTLTAGSHMLDQTMSMDKETAQKAAQIMANLLSLLSDIRHTSADMVSTVSSNLKA
ncbi:TPA: hypothetical protein ACK11E_002268 [Citrobacter pasteurii]|uniref:hypothetical protein n=1 Tax=Citrobacter sp. Cu233 TaxID=2985160 RepID=UPI002578488E|nr:hypothetical protein [Citrobacter sp. Cu233]MDM2932080.1 hypothetical protein [Citrobacter sp. Cu233]